MATTVAEMAGELAEIATTKAEASRAEEHPKAGVRMLHLKENQAKTTGIFPGVELREAGVSAPASI